MKNYIYMLCFLFLPLFSCSDNDEGDLGSQTKEDDTEIGGANPQAEACKEALIASADGWMLKYQPVKDGDTYTFFFDFQEGDIVQTDSDFPEAEAAALYSFGGDEETLELAIKGMSHLQFLPTAQIEDELIVKDFTADKINCVGKKNGQAMVLYKTTAKEVESLKGKKKLLIAIQAKNVLRGVVYNDNLFVSHYIIDYRKNVIDFTYLKDRLVEHTSKAITLDGSAMSWDKVTINGVDISGLVYDEATDKINVTTPTAKVTLFDNSKVMDSFVAGTRFQHLFGANYNNKQGIGDARDDIWEETKWTDLKEMEMNFTWGERSLVACLGGSKGGWLFFHATDNGAPVSTFTDGDKIIWDKKMVFPNASKDEYIKPTEEALSKMFGAYFDKDGLYIIKENLNETSNWNVKHFMLSTTGTAWFKVVQKSGE